MAKGSARGTVERIEPTKAQQGAARRVAESKATVPHLYMEAEVAMAAALELVGADGGGPDPVEIVVRAAALALREVPRVNGAYRDGAAELYSRVNVGVAVTGSEALTVPTIFDADRKSLAEIATEWDDLAGRARDGSITAAEVAGGTFTVACSSVMIRSYAPIISGGQAANIGIGGISERVIPGEAGPVIAPAMTATLAADARMIDASVAAEFLNRFRAAVELPAGLA